MRGIGLNYFALMKLTSSKERERKRMKRIISIILALVVVFSFAGCGSNSGRAPAREADGAETTEPDVDIVPPEEPIDPMYYGVLYSERLCGCGC